MSFLIDTVLAGILIVFLLRHRQAGLSASFFTFSALLLATAAAYLCSALLYPWAARTWIQPGAEQRVDAGWTGMLMAQTPAEQAAERAEMVREMPPPFEKLVRRYGAEPSAVGEAYDRASARGEDARAAAVTAAAAPYAQALARAGVFAAVWAAGFALLRLLLRMMEMRMTAQKRRRRMWHVAPSLLGLCTGVLVVAGLCLMLAWLAPAGMPPEETLRGSAIWRAAMWAVGLAGG